LKILLIHNRYQLHGGEDAVVEQELELLKQYNIVEILYFQNYGGWKGALQFFGSLWNIVSAKKVKQKIHEFKPDVVHIHNWHFAIGPLVFRTIHRLGIPIVHTIHNYRLLCPSAILLNKGKLFTDSLQGSFPWKAVRNKVYRSSVMQTFWLAFIIWFHKKIGTWKKVDNYICLTSFTVNLFKQSNFGISEDKFKVKPNFTASPKVLQQNDREAHFLFIGRLSEEKGITVLLEAFKELPYSLKVAGDGPLKEEVLKTVQQFSNITYLGNLSNKEVEIALQKTQALIFPSICYETFGLVNIEAFSNQTPILASNIGASQSLIIDGYNGFHFIAGNVNDLKETIRKFEVLCSNEKKQLGKNAFTNYQALYSPQLQQGYFDTIYNSVKNNN